MHFRRRAMDCFVAPLLAMTGALALAAAPALADQSPLFSPTTGTVSGLQLTNNYNAAVNALATCNSGASAPANPIGGVPVAGQCWLNTTTAADEIVSVYDGASWLTVEHIDTTAHVIKPVIGGGSSTIASATTTDLGSRPESNLSITGTTTIASLGSSAPIGSVKFLSFAGALTLTYNATSLILPGAANIATAPGDMAIAVSLGSGDWRLAYFPASGGAVTHGLIGIQQFTASGTYTADPGTHSCLVEVQAAGGGSGGTAAASTNQFAMGQASSGGSYAQAFYSGCAINGDAITIGGAGAAGISGGGAGGAASATTLGSHISCPGGAGGGGGSAQGSGTALSVGGAASPSPCTVTGAAVNAKSILGAPGQYGFNFTNNDANSGYGGGSALAPGPRGQPCNNAGVAGNSYGAGASGAMTCASAAGQSGASGGAAIVNIYEYN